MRRIIRGFLILINLVLAALMIGGFLSRFIEPAAVWPLPFLGLIFPIFALLNFFFLIYWIILFKKPFWISFIALIIVTPALSSSMRVFSSREQPDTGVKISLMSYNVRLFDVFNWSGEPDTGTRLLQFAEQSETDIICFQEFMADDSQTLNVQHIQSALSTTPYSFIDYNFTSGKRQHGLAIFSAYPVISGGKGKFPGTRNMFIYADIQFPNDTLRVYNVHLESIHLNYHQYNLIDSLNMHPNNRQEIRKIVKNIREAFNKRTEQVAILKSEISKSPHPVVLCGDFNDTPVSYAYASFQQQLTDSFMESGSGLGTTYQEFFLPLRIDYILYSKELASTDHQVMAVDYSDHKPVRANLHFLPKKANQPNPHSRR